MHEIDLYEDKPRRSAAGPLWAIAGLLIGVFLTAVAFQVSRSDTPPAATAQILQSQSAASYVLDEQVPSAVKPPPKSPQKKIASEPQQTKPNDSPQNGKTSGPIAPMSPFAGNITPLEGSIAPGPGVMLPGASLEPRSPVSSQRSVAKTEKEGVYVSMQASGSAEQAIRAAISSSGGRATTFSLLLADGSPMKGLLVVAADKSLDATVKAASGAGASKIDQWTGSVSERQAMAQHEAKEALNALIQRKKDLEEVYREDAIPVKHVNEDIEAAARALNQLRVPSDPQTAVIRILLR